MILLSHNTYKNTQGEEQNEQLNPRKKLVLKLTSMEDHKHKTRSMKYVENTNFNIMNIFIFRLKWSSNFKTSTPGHYIS